MKPAVIATDAIELRAIAGETLVVRHGLGRPVLGWLVMWQDAPCVLHLADASLDTKEQLILVPSATAQVKILLL